MITNVRLSIMGGWSMYLVLTIFAILVLIIAILGDRNIFLVIDFVKNSLRVTLVALVLIFVFCIFRNNEINISLERLVILNIIQVMYWYLVEKKWNRKKHRVLYLSAWKRDSIKGFIIIVVPSMLNSYYISQAIASTLQFIGIQIY